MKEFFETLLSMQPRTTGATSKDAETPDEIAERMAKEIEGRMPDVLTIKRKE